MGSFAQFDEFICQLATSSKKLLLVVIIIASLVEFNPPKTH